MQGHSFLDKLDKIVSLVNYFIATYYFVFLLVIVSIIFTIYFKWPQFNLAKDLFKTITEKDENAKDNKEHISPYEALMISMATRVGVGSIVGIALAAIQSAPGALFWIWFVAFFQASLSLAENTLAQLYKVPDGKGYKGGPAYYMSYGLNAKFAAKFFSLWMVITCIAFVGIYSNTAFDTISSLAHTYNLNLPDFKAYLPNFLIVKEHTEIKLVLAILMSLFAAVMFFGGAKFIAKFTSYVTPLIALSYIVLVSIGVIMNIDKTSEVLRIIFSTAFDFDSIINGFAGSVVVIGIQRGLFGNEAGLGSTPNTAASAHTSHPIKQGIVQAFCVFVDTLVITGSMFLVCFSPTFLAGISPNITPMELILSAFYDYFGDFGKIYISLVIVMLSFSVTIGAYFASTMNVKYISNKKIYINLFRLLMIFAIANGIYVQIKIIWDIGAVVMSILASINIIALILLVKVVKRVLDDYLYKRDNSLKLDFNASNIGINNTKCWK